MWFRKHTRAQATALQLVGWVKVRLLSTFGMAPGLTVVQNMRDGSVAGVLQGPSERVTTMYVGAKMDKT